MAPSNPEILISEIYGLQIAKIYGIRESALSGIKIRFLFKLFLNLPVADFVEGLRLS